MLTLFLPYPRYLASKTLTSDRRPIHQGSKLHAAQNLPQYPHSKQYRHGAWSSTAMTFRTHCSRLSSIMASLHQFQCGHIIAATQHLLICRRSPGCRLVEGVHLRRVSPQIEARVIVRRLVAVFQEEAEVFCFPPQPTRHSLATCIASSSSLNLSVFRSLKTSREGSSLQRELTRQ